MLNKKVMMLIDRLMEKTIKTWLVELLSEEEAKAPLGVVINRECVHKSIRDETCLRGHKNKLYVRHNGGKSWGKRKKN